MGSNVKETETIFEEARVSALRLGYAGCGFMAQNVHLPNLTGLPDCEVVALAEVRADLGRKVQSNFGIPDLHPDHMGLVRDDSLDVLAVSSGFTTQGEIAVDFLRTGRPVFMEKPMALSVRQADRIVEAAQTPGARLMVGYMKRYDAGNQLARERVQEFLASGELGDVMYVRAHGFCGDWECGMDVDDIETSSQPVPTENHIGLDWLPANRVSKYVGFLQQYVHNLNFMRYLLDAGDDAQVLSVDLDNTGVEGVIVMRIGGVRCLLETGRLAYYRWDDHTQVYFRKGWVHTWAPPLLNENLPAEVEIYRGGSQHSFERPLPADRWSWAYRREMRAFLDCVRTNQPFLASGEDAWTDVRLMEEIFRMHLT